MIAGAFAFLIGSTLGSSPLVGSQETPQQFDARMAWWREARFGMFIHWGLYSVAAGEWNGTPYPGIAEWIMYNAKVPPKEYETLLPQFNPVKFDAKDWVRIAKDAGMKYIVITTKHHDGFNLYPSEANPYNIMKTPFKRDIMRELADECRKHGITICWYHSIWDWHHPHANKANWPKYAEVMKAQLRELLTNYGKIGVLWFDGEWTDDWTAEQGEKLYAELRKLQPDLIINNRVGKGRAGMGPGRTSSGDFGTPEQEIPGGTIVGYDWESCMTMNDTWGFSKHDFNWKSSATLIRMLIDCASKGGNFLLNVGPTGLGEIPPASISRLADIGRWMRVNGESIYGTQAGPFRSLDWGRCTRKGNKLYLHVFDWPNGELVVPRLISKVGDAYLLADKDRAPLKVTRRGEDVVITLPREAPDTIASVVVLNTLEQPRVDNTILQRPDGDVLLGARAATIEGSTARYESGERNDNVGYWTHKDDRVSWEFRIVDGGKFEVVVELACESGLGGSTYELKVGHQTVKGEVPDTGSWTTFAHKNIGFIQLPKGRHTLVVSPVTIAKTALMNLRSVRLVRVGE